MGNGEQLYYLMVLPMDKVFLRRTVCAIQLTHVGVILDIIPGTSVIIDRVDNQLEMDLHCSYSISKYIYDSTYQSLADSVSLIKDHATAEDPPVETFLTTKKKYKPVAKQVKPIPGVLPKDF